VKPARIVLLLAALLFICNIWGYDLWAPDEPFFGEGAREMVVEVDHPAAGRHRTLGTPIKLSDTPGSVRRPAPMLGEHTEEILAELRLKDEAAD